MNCAYHIHSGAVVNCNGCGKPLCPACDHRIKGFPFCQDCIVMGVDLLRQHNQSNYAPFVKKRTSPFVATLLSAICPGLGAAYNGQTTKAIVYFSVFVGLFQMAILTSSPLFVLGFMGMWGFAALDSWRTAQMIRSGVTPEIAEDILVRRFSGNPKLWGIVLTTLGLAFVFQRFFNLGPLMRGILPLMLIGLGFYLLRGYVFKSKSEEKLYSARDANAGSTSFALIQPELSHRESDREADFASRSRFGGWRDR
jgi:TM2 domain-containing membrane protein YozV